MSSSDLAISVRNLSKCYTITHNAEKHSTLAETILHRLKSPLHRPHTKTFWALRDVSFDVKKGEVVGIIGRNGAGKSTLLKILSRITEPSKGKIDLYGRVGSLLEVGTGFHPELTGRENIFLNGAILGMTKAGIRKQFDEIVDFAGIEQFIDTPVKRYSSGMYVRLAFAVAAHLNSEILIIDEVLAVGDAEFQKKCMGKMNDVAHAGRTVLFVSHNLTAIRTLCQSAVLLASGKVRECGPVTAVCRTYMTESAPQSREVVYDTLESAPGTSVLRIKRISVIAVEDGVDRLGVLCMQNPIQIETEFWVLEQSSRLHITYHLVNDQGITVLTTGSPPERRTTGVHRATFTIPGNLLNSGGYFLNLLIVEDGCRVIFQRDSIAAFEIIDVEPRQTAWMGREPCVVRPKLPWTVNR